MRACTAPTRTSRATWPRSGTRSRTHASDRGETPPTCSWWPPPRRCPPRSCDGWSTLGITAVGENYVKELREVHDQVEGARWHYIGAMQTNTAHHVAALADVVETLSGERSTERLARRAAARRALDRGADRGGLHRRHAPVSPPDETRVFADRVASLEGITLRGLMTIPPITDDRRGVPSVVPGAPEPPRSRTRRAP